MSNGLSRQVVDRLLKPIPDGLSVIEKSLPVISFGDTSTAKVATVSLNPSWHEFLNKQGEWLIGPKLRLESLHSLGRASVDELTEDDLRRIVERSNGYFSGNNPYKPWFNQLNVTNQIFGSSYYDGTACHLDLVQWATSDVQKNLGTKWDTLVEEDKEFLRWQIETTSASVFLINGQSSINALAEARLVPALEEVALPYVKKNGQQSSWKVQFAKDGSRLFVGWNYVLANGIPSAIRDQFFSTLRSL